MTCPDQRHRLSECEPPAHGMFMSDPACFMQQGTHAVLRAAQIGYEVPSLPLNSRLLNCPAYCMSLAAYCMQQPGPCSRQGPRLLPYYHRQAWRAHHSPACQRMACQVLASAAEQATQESANHSVVSPSPQLNPQVWAPPIS